MDLQTAVQKVLAEHARHLPDGGKVAHAINAGNVQNALPDVQLQVQNVLVDKEPRIQPDSPPLPPSTGTFYLEIAESPHMSIGIFLMLKGARLPLHDHPQMNVYSRVLFGRVQTTSYDWVGDDWVEEDHVTAEGTGMKSNTSGKDTKIAPKRKLMRLARRSGGGVATAEPATVEVVRPGEGKADTCMMRLRAFSFSPYHE